MGSVAASLEKIVSELPAPAQAEVRDFVEFLIRKDKKKKGLKLQQHWAGGLRRFREKYTAMELQKKSLEWRHK
jgi:Protein of unknown function (DUF2281)